MGAVMETRVILPLGTQVITRCSISTITTCVLMFSLIVSRLNKVQIEEMNISQLNKCAFLNSVYFNF